MTVIDPSAVPTCEQPRVGERLKEARLKQSLTLDDVASRTRVSRSTLRAIESSEYDHLPADAFTRGLITLYANFLGLVGPQVADQFFMERDGGKHIHLSFLKKSRMTHALEPKKLAEPTHISSAALATILLVLIVVSFTGFCLYFAWNPFGYLVDKTRNLSSSVTNTFHPADPATSREIQPPPLTVQAVFLTDCRMLVALDNGKPMEQTYAKGTSMQWTAEREIQLEFSQPNSAQLHFNGTPLPFPDSTEGRYILRLPTQSIPYEE